MKPDHATAVDRATQVRRVRSDLDARLETRRQRPLPGWLANRRGRRAVALLPVVPLLCGILAGVAGDGGVQAALMALVAATSVAAILLLRRVTRLLDAVPDRLLDEREIGERNDAYRRAYHLIGGLLWLLGTLAIADGVLVKTARTKLVPGDGWMQVLLTASLVAIMVPTAVVSWRWRDPVEDIDD